MKSPAYNVKAIPFERIVGTFYTSTEMTDTKLDLLYKSIKDDGYTTPIVCYHDKPTDLYIIIDGHFRYKVMRDHPDIYEREGGMLPVTLIDKTYADLIVSVYRHNITKGIPDVHLTSKMINRLVNLGKSDEYIKKHLDLNEAYLKRFKSLKSFADLYSDTENLSKNDQE